MGHATTQHLFRYFTFQKTTEELLEAIEKKSTATKAKITEREGRITKLRQEYDISEADMTEVVSQANSALLNNSGRAPTSYSVSAKNVEGKAVEERLIPAGVVQNLLTEREWIRQEKEDVTRLGLLRRNLKPMVETSDQGIVYETDRWQVSEEDIAYLGF